MSKAGLVLLRSAAVVVLGGVFIARMGVSTRAEATRDVPAEVIANAEIARQHMRAIVQAIWVYMNDNPHAPPTLSTLYPTWISDPLVFWHPGDSDPPPTTIDNDVPNAPNSSRISFDLDLSDFEDGCPGEQPWIRDNSPANNGGLFVNELYSDWFTVPPGMMPTPTATAVASRILRGLVVAVRVYSNDNQDWWPTDLMQLVPDVGPPCGPARSFWHPGDDQPMPTQITNSQINALDSAQISFEYLVAGMNENDYGPNLAFFRDNSPANNGGCGFLVVYADGRVEFEWLCDGDLNGDGSVDLADFARLAEHLGWWPAEPCDGDFNLDGVVNLADFARLQARFGANCGEAGWERG